MRKLEAPVHWGDRESQRGRTIPLLMMEPDGAMAGFALCRKDSETGRAPLAELAGSPG